MKLTTQAKLILFGSGALGVWLLSASPLMAAETLPSEDNRALLDVALAGMLFLTAIASVAGLAEMETFKKPASAMIGSIRVLVVGLLLAALAHWLTGAAGSLTLSAVLCNIVLLLVELLLATMDAIAKG